MNDYHGSAFISNDSNVVELGLQPMSIMNEFQVLLCHLFTKWIEDTL